jgi:hypothetical protein
MILFLFDLAALDGVLKNVIQIKVYGDQHGHRTCYIGTMVVVENPKKKSNLKCCLKRPLQCFILQPLVHFTPVVLLLAREEDSF